MFLTVSQRNNFLTVFFTYKDTTLQMLLQWAADTRIVSFGYAEIFFSFDKKKLSHNKKIIRCQNYSNLQLQVSILKYKVVEFRIYCPCVSHLCWAGFAFFTLLNIKPLYDSIKKASINES